MSVTTREYRLTDYEALILCLDGLKNFHPAINPLERARGNHGFDSKSYTDYFLREVVETHGHILVTEDDSGIAGCVVGTVEAENGFKTGRIIELFVAERVRNKGVGRHLVGVMEKYFKINGCDAVVLQVYNGNDAHDFYRKIGYSDRCIEMMKML